MTAITIPLPVRILWALIPVNASLALPDTAYATVEVIYELLCYQDDVLVNELVTK